MARKFKPTIREVLKETGKNLGKGILYGAGVAVAIPVTLCGGLFYCIGMTHILPTCRRLHGSSDPYDDASIPISLIGLGGGAIGYSIAISKTDHFELLAIPIVTNVASGVYELYRYSKEEIIRRHERIEYDKLLKKDRQRLSELEKGVESKLDSELEKGVKGE